MATMDTSIFDRKAGWGHSASTNFNPSTNSNVTVQAYWRDPADQSDEGEDTDIADTDHIASLSQIGSQVARDGVLAAVTLAGTDPGEVADSVVTRASVTNGVSTNHSYFAGYTGEPGNDRGGAIYGAILSDRVDGWGHDEESSAAALAYNTELDIAANQGTTTNTPYDNNGNVAAVPILPNKLTGKEGNAANDYTNPSWGGINDRTAGWGHSTGGGVSVSIAGSTLSVPAMHD